MNEITILKVDEKSSTINHAISEPIARSDSPPQKLNYVIPISTLAVTESTSHSSDGGPPKWMIIFCSHLTVMTTWGLINSFGAFQTYFTSVLPQSPSEISWIGSTQAFLLFFIGTFSGRMTDAGYFRYLFGFGTICAVVGPLASSFCSTFWSLFLTLALVVGIGNGLLFCPMLTVMSPYFSKRKALAIGVAACGSATGGMIYPTIVRQLLPQIGFAWTMRVIALVQLVFLGITNLGLKPRAVPQKQRALLDWEAFREKPYVLYMIASFLNLTGVYFSFYYIASFARMAVVPPFSYPESLNLLLILNGVSLFGRLGLNYIADHKGTMNVFIVTTACTSVILFAWSGVHSRIGIYCWSVACGIGSGGVQTLFIACVSTLTDDISKLGTRIGMLFTIVSFAILIGPPIGGALITAMDGSYLGAQVFAGSAMLLCTIFSCMAKFMATKVASSDIVVAP